MNRCIANVLLSGCFLTTSFGLLANETDSLFELSLEELLNVTVSIASAESENVIETPAIVSRYNRADLEAMGITKLDEMFNFIPGVVVQDSLTGWGVRAD